MADQLVESYNAWKEKEKTVLHTEFQAFQAGFSTGAAGLRMRAQSAVREVAGNGKVSNDVLNELLTAIGSLPDIPKG